MHSGVGRSRLAAPDPYNVTVVGYVLPLADAVRRRWEQSIWIHVLCPWKSRNSPTNSFRCGLVDLAETEPVECFPTACKKYVVAESWGVAQEASATDNRDATILQLVALAESGWRQWASGGAWVPWPEGSHVLLSGPHAASLVRIMALSYSRNCTQRSSPRTRAASHRYPRVNGSSTCPSRSIQTDFVCWYSSRASWPFSRPSPLAL